MTLWWGYTGLTWVYYVPSFIAGTLIGGSVAFSLLKKLAKNGMLLKMQQELGAKVFDRPVTVAGDSMGIVFLGIIAYLAVLVLVKNVLKATGAAMAMPWVVLALFVAVAAYYYFSHRKESVNAWRPWERCWRPCAAAGPSSTASQTPSPSTTVPT